MSKSKAESFYKNYFKIQAERVILKSALGKAIVLKNSYRKKKYNDFLNNLDSELEELIKSNLKLYNKSDWSKMAGDYRIDKDIQLEITKKYIGKALDIDEFLEWCNSKEW